MVRLNSPKRKEFVKEDFEEYPVWVWDDEMEYKLPISDKDRPSSKQGPRAGRGPVSGTADPCSFNF
jgi:hypothetical protein